MSIEDRYAYGPDDDEMPEFITALAAEAVRKRYGFGRTLWAEKLADSMEAEVMKEAELIAHELKMTKGET